MSDAFVTGVGAFGPFGLDARQCALLTRASKLVPRPTALRDARGGKMADARAMSLPDDLFGIERMLALAVPALQEAALDANLSEIGRPLPLFLALPEVRPDDDARFGRSFVEALAERSKVSIDVEQSLFYRAGSVGIASALERARAHVAGMARGEATPVVVGGVDTFHHPAVLKWLDEEKRLLSEFVHDGFVPSEGAAFAVIQSTASRSGARFAKVTDAAVAQQPPPTPDESRTGDALSELTRKMSQRFARGEVPWILPDVNGETHRVNEWIVTKIRNEDVFQLPDLVEERLCDHAGDAGAAWGALALVYLANAYRLGFAPAEGAVVTLSCEGTERGAFVVERA